MSNIPSAATQQTVLRYTLNTGAALPAVGLGSWMGAMGEATDRVEAMVATALKVGYRAFDTAAGYGNEEAVGRAIRTSGIPREEVFVTTKMRKKNHHLVREGFDASLEALGLDYVDLYLMHWPIASVDGITVQPDEFPTIVDTWRAMEALIPTGKCRAIGVSNFSIPLLEKLLDPASGCTIVPAVNQIECHPSRPQFELVEWCQKKGIHVTAYSSLGQPGGRPEKGALAIPDVFFAGEPLKPLADKYNLTVGQVLLSWAVARGISVIPKTEKEERMRANASLIRLNDEDTTFLNEWHKQKGMHRSLCPYHSLEPVPGVFGWTYEQLGWDGMEAGGVIS